MSWTLKNGYLARAGGQNITSGCLPSGKVWIGSFWPKTKVFYRPEWTKRGTTWKWILSIFNFRNEYYKHLDRKMGIFCKFVLTSARNLSLLKQFTYMHLKGLVTHFQKMVLFVILWLMFWRLVFKVVLK